MSFFDTQNPGIGGLDEITDAEAAFLQNLAALSYSNGDILYYNNGLMRRLAIGSTSNVLTVAAGLPSWAPPSGGLTDGDKGDITVSSSGSVWTIDADVISTYGRTLTVAASASAARTVLALGTLATQSGTFSGTSSGTNTGDQTTISGNAGTATALATARSIYGNNFDGTAALAQIIASTFGGTGNGFTKFSGPTTSEKTFTLPNASATVLTDNAVVTVAQGGSGVGTLTGILKGNGTSAFTAVTAPSGTIVGTTDTQTLTNKRNTRRVVTTTQSATPTINTDNTDVAAITGLAQAITSFTTNLTGTPVAGDSLIIEITDNGTARAITWGATFEASTVALPTTTVISTKLTIGFFWNTATSKWRCVAAA